MRLALALLVSAALACGGSAPDCTLDFTPAGPFPRACIHEVPSGATVTTSDGGTTIVSVGGNVVASYGPCPCPRSDGG